MIDGRAAIDVYVVPNDLKAATAPTVVLVSKIIPRPRLVVMTRVETKLIRLDAFVGLDNANLVAARRKGVSNDARRKWELLDKEVTDAGGG